MINPWMMRYLPPLAGAGTVAVLVAALLLIPADWRENLRETGFDLVLAMDQRVHPLATAAGQKRVVVIDIDDRSLEMLGPWPWPRDVIAKLVDAIAKAKPAAVAVDILFAEPDERSPAALARRLGALTSRPELNALAAELTDYDANLADAEAGVPLVLGYVLSPEPSENFPHTPLAMRGSPSFDGLWGAAGAVGPIPTLAAHARGIGALSLPANSDGVVRYVPLLVSVGGNILPGLALEAGRLARGTASYLLDSNPPTLVTADLRIPFPDNGLLRLLPVAPQMRAARTISAADIIGAPEVAARLDGAVIFVGGSAPELGGLRPTVTDALTPSVQIQADAVTQIFAGRFPRPLAHAGSINILLIFALALVSIFTATRLAPWAGMLIFLGATLLVWTAATAGSIVSDRLTDPLTPSLIAAGVFVAASVTSFGIAHRRELLVRRRFEQRLAPAIVRRIVENPALVKLTGERREITSLFTDIEGLTSMTHRADPQELVAMLDVYFERIIAIVVAHGGMVDKIVGDAVHAMFNAPIDLSDHPQRAVECAVEIRQWTEIYRAAPAAAALRLGRTRIGIETGEVVVGDVGVQSKLDYTAYGDAVNTAARLEGANKELGSSICVGPAAAARCDPAFLRPLGTISIRGREEILAVYEPWPPETSADWRARYVAAFGMINDDPARASAMFTMLAEQRKDEVITRLISRRLGGAVST